MLSYLGNKPGKATLKIQGSVLHVLNGKISDDLLQPVAEGEFTFALGAGTFSTKEKVGEAFVFSGTSYASWVEEDAPLTESHLSMKSPFLMGVDSKSSGGVLLELKADTPMQLQSLYLALAHSHPEGFAVVAYAQCNLFESTYVKKPPIYSESINPSSEVLLGEIRKLMHIRHYILIVTR